MEKLIIVRTPEQLEQLRSYLTDKEYVSFDTETTGVDKESIIIGFSVAAEVDVGYYVVLHEWDGEKLVATEVTLDEKPVTQLLRQLYAHRLIMHNAIFDCWMVKNNFGIDLMPALHTDTMILAHILDENRRCGLKELGVGIFGEDAAKEQAEMKESVTKNGGLLTKACYELYKADSELLGKYGAKDAILTLKLFYEFVEPLYEQGLDKFFYGDESMPLLRGPTYDLNCTGLRVDSVRLQQLRGSLEAEIAEQRAFIQSEIAGYLVEKYPGTSKKTIFNIDAPKQLAWLLFERLGNEFNTLTDEGKELCKALELRVPYAPNDKRTFIAAVKAKLGTVWHKGKYNWKTQKSGRPKTVAEPWMYLNAGKQTLEALKGKYKWLATYLEYKKNMKLLNTYVIGIQERMKYGIIRPSFLQHGTTSGRYSSKSPNFQNLPREDKRIKNCIIAREGKVFVGADYAQLEPRVFASVSQDLTLMDCFASGDDFYSVVGIPVFGINGVSTVKDDPNSFAKLHPKLRDRAKVLALATPYGRTASFQALSMGISTEEAQEMINNYFAAYPSVEKMMLDSHKEVKTKGIVYNLFGRPRRIPAAQLDEIGRILPTQITEVFGKTTHAKLPYEIRTLLNLGMNHRVQSTAASIMNRAAIAVWNKCKKLSENDSNWREVKIVLQLHDELIIEGPECLENAMISLLKDCMEVTVTLPGVALVADPKAAKVLGELK